MTTIRDQHGVRQATAEIGNMLTSPFKSFNLMAVGPTSRAGHGSSIPIAASTSKWTAIMRLPAAPSIPGSAMHRPGTLQMSECAHERIYSLDRMVASEGRRLLCRAGARECLQRWWRFHL